MEAGSVTRTFSEIILSLTIFVKTFFQALGIVPVPCEQPIQYTLGAIDSRFGISEVEVLEATKQAESLWENASGQDLFEYNTEDGLPVQFMYDERQQKTEAGQDLQARLDSLPVEESEAEAKAQIAKYEQAKKEYESKRTSYERSADVYNDRVKNINKSGGATENQQKDLKKEYKALQKQFQALESARQEVNSVVVTTNQYISANQATVETYSKEVTTFQEQYGGEGEVFDQGVYTGTDITIYQYDDRPRLVLVLAHEMGHALGIDHVEDSESLMYYLMRDQDIQNIILSEADTQSLAGICQSPKFPWQK